jgi:hypothetical protein
MDEMDVGVAEMRWDVGLEGKEFWDLPRARDATARVWIITWKIGLRTLFVKRFVFPTHSCCSLPHIASFWNVYPAFHSTYDIRRIVIRRNLMHCMRRCRREGYNTDTPCKRAET